MEVEHGGTLRAMRFSVALAMCDPDQYLPVARAADEAGWHAVAVPDSPFFPEQTSAAYHYSADGGRYWNGDTPFLDPWVAIPAMAAVTERLRFYTMVLKLPIRQPLLIAKTVATAAVLSGDRVALGVGLSWMPEEFVWLAEDFASRGPRTDEAVAIIRTVLAGGMVEHHGKHYDFDRLQMSPVPSAPVPIYIGGMTPPALRRAARIGDGWISANVTTDELALSIEQLRAALAAQGRTTDGFEIKVVATDAFDLDGFRRLRDLGVTDAITQPWWFYGGDPNSVTTKVDAVRRFADEIAAEL
jgi:probable F420-dependent oxidoreductase